MLVVIPLQVVVALQLFVGMVDLLCQADVIEFLHALLHGLLRRVHGQIDRSLSLGNGFAEVRGLRLLHHFHPCLMLLNLDLVAFLLDTLGRLVVAPLCILFFLSCLVIQLLPTVDLLAVLFLQLALLGSPVRARGVQRLARGPVIEQFLLLFKQVLVIFLFLVECFDVLA